MKFGKRLQHQMEETLPEWRDKFLSYKRLKRLLRLIATKGAAPPKGVAAAASRTAEAEFLRLLNAEVEKFNAFFVEQEEDFVIRHKELKERVEDVVRSVGPAGVRPSEAEYAAEISRIRKDVVNLHGEMVLLENYSNVNYTGLAKILKKYDKRTGRLLRLPFIEKVLEQPFFTTDLISGLVKELEDTIHAVFPRSSAAASAAWELQRDDLEPETRSDRKAGSMDEPVWGLVFEAEQGILRNTVAALVTMRELRRGSSTYSHFSLPPLDLSSPSPPESDVPFSSPIPIL